MVVMVMVVRIVADYTLGRCLGHVNPDVCFVDLGMRTLVLFLRSPRRRRNLTKFGQCKTQYTGLKTYFFRVSQLNIRIPQWTFPAVFWHIIRRCLDTVQNRLQGLKNRGHT